MNDFSYPSYRQLIEAIISTIPLKDFTEVKETDDHFFILRHDVEFSVEKAYELAQFERDHLGITSSYFFQTRNYAYNPFAFQNIALIQHIAAMGHRIGLHVHTNGLIEHDPLVTLIKKDLAMLQNGLELPVDRFSFHRPKHEVLHQHIQIDGLINTYNTPYFHFYTKPPKLEQVHYFSDSEHRWNYGHPLSILDEPIKKIQLLTHPYSWSQQGMDNVNNFKQLIQRQEARMKQSMHDECNHFPNELLTNVLL
jgi:hypothetical protein